MTVVEILGVLGLLILVVNVTLLWVLVRAYLRDRVSGPRRSPQVIGRERRLSTPHRAGRGLPR